MKFINLLSVFVKNNNEIFKSVAMSGKNTRLGTFSNSVKFRIVTCKKWFMACSAIETSLVIFPFDQPF